MRRGDLVTPYLLLALAGCGWIEEQRKQARRNRAETELVDAVAAGNLRTVREALDRDRTLANAVR